jgi:hypothetical protein
METVKTFKKPNKNAILRPVLASFLVSAPIPKNLETKRDSGPRGAATNTLSGLRKLDQFLIPY